MNIKKRTIYWSSAVIFILLFISVLNYIIDPYQIFHKHSHGLSLNTRYQNAGLINSYLAQDNYDSVIIGTSMIENFHPDQVEKVLHWKKVLKLPAAGSEPLIQVSFLRKSLQTGHIKHVLLGIHTTYTTDNINDIKQKSATPIWLYKGSLINLYSKYLLSADTLKLSKKILFGQWKGIKDINEYSSWMTNYKNNFITYNNTNNTKLHAQNITERRNTNKNYKLSLRTNYPAFDQLLIPIIKEHPDTEFILFFPPYSTYFYSISSNQKLSSILSMRRILIQQTHNLKNVKIFAFDNFAFTNDLNNYKDEEHYSDKINDLIIQYISKDKGSLNLDNIMNYEKTFLENTSNYLISTH